MPMETWKRSFNALMIAEVLAIMGFSTSNPIIPLYVRELGISDPTALNFWTGAINGVSSLALAIMAPLWGSLADSYGRKLMLLRAMFAGAITLGLLALTTSPWQVLVLKTLQGCFTGTVAAATVLTATIVPREQVGYRLGLMQMAVFVGNSLGPLFGGVVTDLFGSRINFVATAVFLGLAGFVVMRQVTEDFTPVPRSGSVLRNAVPDFSVLGRNGALQSLLVAIFVVQFSNAVASPIMPLVILDMNKGAAGTGSLAGLVIGVAAAAGALGSFTVGRWSNRIGYGKALLGCVVGACLFYFPQGFARAPWQLLLLRALSGFFMGGTMPTVNALIAELAESGKQGAIYGLSSSVGSMGNALGPAFGAFVASGLGYSWVFFATTVFLGLLAWGVGRTVLRRPGGVAPGR